jgi:hypothetical protein
MKTFYLAVQAAAKKPSLACKCGHKRKYKPSAEHKEAASCTFKASRVCETDSGSNSGWATLKAWAIASFSSGNRLQVAYTKRPPDFNKRAALAKMDVCLTVSSATDCGD